MYPTYLSGGVSDRLDIYYSQQNKQIEGDFIVTAKRLKSIKVINSKYRKIQEK
jgi:hypothetical protein